MPKPTRDKEIRYTIRLNKREIITQNKNAIYEWPLNGFIWIIKNTTKTKEETLRFRTKSN